MLCLIDEKGWLNSARALPSPNCDDRPDGEAIRLIVIHAISLPPEQFGGEAVADLFLNRLDPNGHPYFRDIANARVSAHFFIRRDGELIQFVSCFQRAWHAGVSNWKGRERCNDFSLGIELEGSDNQAFDASQYRVLNMLLANLGVSFPNLEIVGHSDIAPGRKTDPGPFFDWAQIVQASAG